MRLAVILEGEKATADEHQTAHRLQRFRRRRSRRGRGGASAGGAWAQATRTRLARSPWRRGGVAPFVSVISRVPSRLPVRPYIFARNRRSLPGARRR